MKRPQMKTPALKTPSFLVDLYHDLRDRRLLPLIALVLVAIVATPILLGQKSETTPPPSGTGLISALKERRGGSSELTVVEATPGLRAPHKRLRGRKPTDPFRKNPPQQSATSAAPGGGEGEGASAASAAPVTSTSTTVTETSSSKTTRESTTTKTNGSEGAYAGSEAGGESANGTLYTWAADLTIVHSSGSEAEGNKQSDPPMTLKAVLAPTTLPSQKVQVVTYVGRSPKTHRALFLVSPEVTGVFGEGKCAAGTATCQLIELELGFPEVFEYGEGADRYRVEVTKLEPVANGHP